MMEFLASLIGNPLFATALAACAFLVSVLGYISTREASITSQKALEETRKLNEEQVRSRLVKSINREMNLVKEALVELQIFQKRFEMKGLNIKGALSEYAKLFDEYIPMYEGKLNEIEAKLEGVGVWEASGGAAEYLRMLNEQEVALGNTEFSVKRSHSLVSQFQEKVRELEKLFTRGPGAT